MQVTFQNGDVVVFGVPGIEEFHMLVETLSSSWARWIYIGGEAAVMRKSVVAVYYLSDGVSKDAE